MDSVKEFLETTGSGDGSGSGSGSGYGYGYGDGSGSGSGSGSGYGYGYGDGSGSGSGSGDGSGDGSGSGSGYGYGDGSGYGSGYGYGYGYGDGSGYGIKSINGLAVYQVDWQDTVITHIKNGVAKGGMLGTDLKITPCYIAKQGNTFAHGETVRLAMSALREKLLEDMPEEERIEAFIEHFTEDKKYTALEFYEWHHILTGSCEMGRKEFARNKGIDIDKDVFTVKEFLDITRNDYGGDVIRKAEAEYERRHDAVT